MGMQQKIKNRGPVTMTPKIYVIAEAGVNHNGDLNLAKQLIDIASCAGADAVKFQCFSADRLVTRYAPKAEYQQTSTDRCESQYSMIQRLELSIDDHCTLMDYCKTKPIDFLSSPFDSESVLNLAKLGLNTIKIPSGEITNFPYLRTVGSLGNNVILSTGMSEISEIDSAIKVIAESGTPRHQITLLHCNTEYPTPFEDVNLRAIATLRDRFNLAVGYSDHTIGVEVAIAAASLGAVVIEKHFTINRSLVGPDHQASLDPNELNRMIASIRHIERAMGDGIKKVSSSELKNRDIARKSIVASTTIHIGDVFSEYNLSTKRPGNGINPMHWNELIGTTAKREYLPDDQI
jgi:N,N'-diacetyllegionaminate synthase